MPLKYAHNLLQLVVTVIKLNNATRDPKILFGIQANLVHLHTHKIWSRDLQSFITLAFGLRNHNLESIVIF